MAENEKPVKMGRPKGSKDRKPRRTEGYKESSPKNLEKARSNSPIMQGQKGEMPKGYNAKMVSFILAITPKEPLDYSDVDEMERRLSLIHISEPTRQAEISYAVFCLKKKKKIK